MRKPRSLILEPHSCHWKGETQRMAYGCVWVDIVTDAKRLSAADLSAARASIAAVATSKGLTFAQWVTVTGGWDVEQLAYRWHVAADFVWDAAYEATQL